MKKILVFALLAFTAIVVAQLDPQLLKHQPASEYENIHVEKIADDSNQTAFIIWIKHEVPLHKHAWHTENVYILAGKGEMTLGENTFQVKKGDYFNIPPDTPHSLKVLSSMPVQVLSIQSPHFDGSDRILISEP